jgi:hypothetical protein
MGYSAWVDLYHDVRRRGGDIEPEDCKAACDLPKHEGEHLFVREDQIGMVMFR